MKKAPKIGALEWNLLCAPVRGAPKLLLLFRSSFFLRGGFLRCALHRLILPNIKFCDFEKSQCDSYIRLFATKVKRKMHFEPASSYEHRAMRCDLRGLGGGFRRSVEKKFHCDQRPESGASGSATDWRRRMRTRPVFLMETSGMKPRSSSSAAASSVSSTSAHGLTALSPSSL
jgi:hypothetical protein